MTIIGMRRRRVGALLTVLVLGASSFMAGCGSDSSKSQTPRTSRVEDTPDTGPQSGTHPGPEPAEGTAPANG